MTSKNYNTYKKLLSEFITHKSVSTDPQFQAGIQSTAEYLHEIFTSAGFESEIVENYDNPVVLARFEANPKAQTVLVYGHYDVQPAELEDGWDSNPFELTETEDKLIARGTIDNKGQIMIHIATVLDLIKKNELKYNATFMIEGNEETGSPNLEQFVHDYKEKLTSDYILISDGEIVGNHPILEVGFRGVMNATLEFRTAVTELHSGLVGGSVPNAAHEMSRFLAGLHKDLNKVQIPGFYDDVQEPTQEQLDNNRTIPFTSEDYLNITGTKYYFTESDYDIYTQTGLRPSLEVTGLHSGYTGVGYKNGVPPTAVAKFNFRFVADQNPEDIAQKFEKYISEAVPDYVEWKLSLDESAKPVFLNTSDSIFDTVSELLTDVYKQKVLRKYVGGSIPIVGTFQEVLDVPQLLIPLANEDCNMHGVHENFRIELVHKALVFSEKFFSGQ